MKEKTDAFRLFRIILRLWKNMRDRFAGALDITQERKATIYIDLARSTTLKDISYWLQIFFSAGIATLGLVLNSPAVIIGAMLISPLMGPILAGGLALATGDLILAVRAFANLFISTLGAITFAVILVAFLPFKEVTGEIFSRTSPNTLDLGIALFSGAIGSVAICKEVKGVVTSIPGVAIAVALMPPLCVVGFGIGLALSINEGFGVAGGGALLYLTNLVAITFMAMVVFILLRIDTPQVRQLVREWREADPESVWWKSAIDKIPSLEKAREIRSVTLRLLMILVPLLLIFIPLSQSYSSLKQQYQQKQAENRILSTAKSIWNENFKLQTNGQARSLDETKVNLIQDPNTGEEKIELYMRVIDNEPYTSEERNEYLSELAKQLNRREDSISLQLVEIPTSLRDYLQPKSEPKAPPPTVAELQAKYLESVKNAMTGLILPSPAKMLDFKISNSPSKNAEYQLFYLSQRDIDVDGRALLANEIKTKLNLPNALVSFERIPVESKEIRFINNRADFVNGNTENPLDEAGKTLQEHPTLQLEVVLTPESNEELLAERQKKIKEFLNQNWGIEEKRIVFATPEVAVAANTIRIFLPE